MTDEDKQLIFSMAYQLTGFEVERSSQPHVFLTNVERRMHATGIDNVFSYLMHAKADVKERAQLLSSLSIHTTSWFRENAHMVVLQKVILARASVTEPFRVWCCACSTGEEVYTFALLLEEFRRFHSAFEYSVLGSDIDGVSLDKARRAIYPKKDLNGPISYYKNQVLLGSGPTEDYFTFTEELRKRCSFAEKDLRNLALDKAQFNLVVCRNVLIYFEPELAVAIIKQLVDRLTPGGHLIVGHSEIIDHKQFGLLPRGNTVYEKPRAAGEKPVVHAKRSMRQDLQPRVILIGASTGGPQALAKVLHSLNKNSPPILIAQHISGDFSRGFAEQICLSTGLTLGDLTDRAPLLPGHMYFPNADCHLAIKVREKELQLMQIHRETLKGHCPSIDYLFESAVPIASSCVAILLSGMGRDGALGMSRLHREGAYTLAQSEEDCVVFGMPKEAIALKAVDFVGSADEIHEALTKIIAHQSI